MYKITVQLPDKPDFEYMTTIVPVIGDRICSKEFEYYIITERILFADNPNYVILRTKP